MSKFPTSAKKMVKKLQGILFRFLVLNSSETHVPVMSVMPPSPVTTCASRSVEVQFFGSVSLILPQMTLVQTWNCRST